MADLDAPVDEAEEGGQAGEAGGGEGGRAGQLRGGDGVGEDDVSADGAVDIRGVVVVDHF